MRPQPLHPPRSRLGAKLTGRGRRAIAGGSVWASVRSNRWMGGIQLVRDAWRWMKAVLRVQRRSGVLRRASRRLFSRGRHFRGCRPQARLSLSDRLRGRETSRRPGGDGAAAPSRARRSTNRGPRSTPRSPTAAGPPTNTPSITRGQRPSKFPIVRHEQQHEGPRPIGGRQPAGSPAGGPWSPHPAATGAPGDGRRGRRQKAGSRGGPRRRGELRTDGGGWAVDAREPRRRENKA